jgi:hypothetical protein
MAVIIVDGLEKVDVCHRHCEGDAIPLRSLEFGLENPVEFAPIGKTRERIRSAQALKLLIFRGELALGSQQFEMEPDSGNQIDGVEWLRNRIRSAFFEKTRPANRIRHGGQNDKGHRLMTGSRLLTYAKEFLAIESGHFEVAQHEIRLDGQQELEPADSIIRFDHAIDQPGRVEGSADFRTLSVRVFNHENGGHRRGSP